MHRRLLLHIAARIIVVVQIIVVVVNRQVLITMAIQFGPCRVIGGRRGHPRRAFSEAFLLLTKGEHRSC